MSPETLQIRLRKPLFRVFAIASLAFAFAMLPGCGENKAEEDDDEDDIKAEESANAVRKTSPKEKVRTAKLQIRSLEDALDSYKLDVGHYPRTLQDLVTNEEQAPKWNGPYMRSIPKDPWGMEYQYEREGVHDQSDFDLWSFGADGQEGGEGENADITNWQAE